jgi:hypothetical protein
MMQIGALALEVPPSIKEQDLSGYDEALGRTEPAPSVELEAATAAMLKDVEFLLDTVLALPQQASSWQLRKVRSMSEWLHGRLSGAADQACTAQPLHHAARLASLIYCWTIEAREPFSKSIKEEDVVALVDAVWKVPLELWNGHLGTLLWVLATVLPAAREMELCYRTRAMMTAAAVQLALTDWKSASAVLGRIIKLQAWLRCCPQDQDV